MLITLLAIIAFLSYLYLAVRRPDWALLLIIAGLPLYLLRFQIYGFPSTALEAMVLISFAVWFWRDFWSKRKLIFASKAERRPYPFRWEIILLLIISFLATGVAGFSWRALGIWRAYFFKPLLVFILFFNILKGAEGKKKALLALLVSASLVSLFAIFQKFTGLFIANPLWQAAATRRVTSFFPYPNAVGLFLGPLVVVFAGWLWSLPWKTLKERHWEKIVITLVIILSLAAIYSAKSWGAIVGLAAAILVFLVLAGKKSRIAAITIIIAAALSFSLVAPLRDAAIEKLSFQGLSGQIRKQQWKETLVMLNHGHFFWGAGLASYQAAVTPYHQDGLFYNSDHLPDFDNQLRASSTLRAKYWQPVEIYLYPHNIFLNFWTELGLLGALLFAWIIIKYLAIGVKKAYVLIKANDPEGFLALGLTAAMVVIIIHGLVDVPYFKNDLSVLFWLLVAMITI